MAQFMLLLKGSFDQYQQKNAEEKKEIMDKYAKFVGDLHKEKRLVHGDPAAQGQWIISPSSQKNEIRKISDDDRENITGYFIIEADSMDQALSIVRQCPASSHGDYMQVLQLGYES